MPKGYIIARVDVDDADQYALYAKGALEAMRIHGCRILARGGRSEALEGPARQRNVILEFDDFDTAKRYFASPEYRKAREFRAPISTGEFVVVEGYDGAQP